MECSIPPDLSMCVQIKEHESEFGWLCKVSK
jgi:hypothetical protein